jgi:hypothetical protein
MHRVIHPNGRLDENQIIDEWMGIWRDEALPMPLRKASLDNVAKQMGMLKDRKVNEYPELEGLLAQLGNGTVGQLAGRKILTLAKNAEG